MYIQIARSIKHPPTQLPLFSSFLPSFLPQLTVVEQPTRFTGPKSKRKQIQVPKCIRLIDKTRLYFSQLLLSWVGGWVFKIYLDDSRNNCFAGQTQAANREHDSRGDYLGDVDTKELFPSHNNQILLLGIDLVWLLFPFSFLASA